MWTILSVAILLWTIMLVSASCPKDCQCASVIPTCAPGVNLISDHCACCKVCAKQLNDDCSEAEPCDHGKGLECNYGARHHSGKGICRAKSQGRSCDYNNKIYQNGESFHPNCKNQCTCMDGVVGCVSLCPHEFAVRKLGCAKPRVVKLPGRCCGKLQCSEREVARRSVVKHRKRQSEDDLTMENELAPIWRQEPMSSPDAVASDPLSYIASSGDMCIPQTTAWSPCSKSCGAGVSTRMTNSNLQCKLEKETRICEVRPCSQADLGLKDGQTCRRSKKATVPVKLTDNGCRSLKKYWPRYCGFCADGRCCSPHRTETLPVRFRCKDGETLIKKVMMIQTCKCKLNCSPGKKSARFWNDSYKY